MAKHRKKKKKKDTFSSIFAFDSNIEMPYKQQIANKIVSHAQSLKGKSLSEFLSRAFKHHLCPEEIYCCYKTEQDFLGNWNDPYKLDIFQFCKCLSFRHLNIIPSFKFIR